MTIEPLEPRRLFHTFTLSHGVLTLITHPDSETIGLRILGPSYLATIDEEGVAESFPVAKVKSVIIEALAGDDSINVNPDVNVPMTIQAGSGNDTVFAGAGPTVLEGDEGDDLLVDGGGADTFLGGAGNDTADFSVRSDNLRITLDDVADDGPVGNRHDNVGSDVETILGGSGNDSILGANADNLLMGNGGRDTLVGLGGDDTLSGGNGNDLLNGGLGPDLIVGSAGLKDKVTYEDRSEQLSLTLDGAANDGAAGENDNISGSVEDIICGGGGCFVQANGKANLIYGGTGNDNLIGGGGNDTLIGNAGNDTLSGQGGNDVFICQDGQMDSVSGGSGHDSFEPSVKNGPLTDANDALDTIP